jgi:hypothetical protein
VEEHTLPVALRRHRDYRPSLNLVKLSDETTNPPAGLSANAAILFSMSDSELAGIDMGIVSGLSMPARPGAF